MPAPGKAMAVFGRATAVVVALVSAAPPRPSSAQGPAVTREELMRRWDADRNGTVDASEAEAARARMRRERVESRLQGGIDPLTGKPRIAAPSSGRDGAAMGRPAAPLVSPLDRETSSSGNVDDGGLLLVPGTGEQAGRPLGSAAAQTERPLRPAPRDEAALPGTRVPAGPATIPSVAPKLPTGVPGRDRLPASMPGRFPPTGDAGRRLWTVPGTPGSTTGGTPPALSGRQPPGSAPGIISGGARAGAPPARPGYGTTAAPQDLNAGRLPGGMPQTRGTPPGGAGPRSPGDPRASRAVPVRPPVPGAAAPQYGRDILGRTMPSAGPSLMLPSAPRPQVSQPSVVRPRTPTIRSTTPIVPRVNTDGL